MNMYKKIYKKLKKASKIVIARHIGPDPDALGSTLGLKEIIQNTFPQKEVYVIGTPTSRFKFLGEIDKYNSTMQDALLIVLDTPDAKRVDGLNPLDFTNSIKIDHHPYVQKTCQIEWIDEKASSACQMVTELVLNTKLKMNQKAAEILYTGIVADTNRFMFAYTTEKTFKIVSELLKYQLDITKIYNNLYLRPYKEIKFQGFISQNFIINEDNVAYIIIDENILNQYEVDVATPGNMINNFNHIKEIIVWVTFTYDKDIKAYRTSIRSRGPVINDVAAKFGGGGHMYASGARLKTTEEMQQLIQGLNQRTKEYLQKKEN